MIGRIAGRLEYKAVDHVLIDVRGVGYVVHVSDRVLAGLPAVGQAVALYTDLLVREDLLQLFGFASLLEKEWHRLLMGVQGVGAKASMAILGALGAEALGRAIAIGDWSAVARAKGIGPKTAQRVIMELKDKAPLVLAMGGTAALRAALEDDLAVIEGPGPISRAAPQPAPAAGSQSALAEAMSALTNLGYAPSDAAGAVATAQANAPAADTATLIRAALRLLAPKA